MKKRKLTTKVLIFPFDVIPDIRTSSDELTRFNLALILPLLVEACHSPSTSYTPLIFPLLVPKIILPELFWDALAMFKSIPLFDVWALNNSAKGKDPRIAALDVTSLIDFGVESEKELVVAFIWELLVSSKRESSI